MACKPDVFDMHDQGFSKNILDYWRYIRDNDLYLAYAVVPPAGAKGAEAVATPQSKAEAEWGETAGLRVVKETDAGVIVSGFKILATAACLADEVLIGNVLPLPPGDEKFAITFALPVDAPGLKLISRRPYEKLALSELDDPLAFRYDETDAVVYCDDVFVPWERVFAHNHIDTARAIFYDTPSHTLGNAQAHIRLLPKLRLILGIIKRVAEENGIAQIPAVRETLYALGVRVAMVEGLIVCPGGAPRTVAGRLRHAGSPDHVRDDVVDHGVLPGVRSERPRTPRQPSVPAAGGCQHLRQRGDDRHLLQVRDGGARGLGGALQADADCLGPCRL